MSPQVVAWAVFCALILLGVAMGLMVGRFMAREQSNDRWDALGRAVVEREGRTARVHKEKEER